MGKKDQRFTHENSAAKRLHAVERATCNAANVPTAKTAANQKTKSSVKRITCEFLPQITRLHEEEGGNNE